MTTMEDVNRVTLDFYAREFGLKRNIRETNWHLSRRILAAFILRDARQKAAFIGRIRSRKLCAFTGGEIKEPFVFRNASVKK